MRVGSTVRAELVPHQLRAAAAEGLYQGRARAAFRCHRFIAAKEGTYAGDRARAPLDSRTSAQASRPGTSNPEGPGSDTYEIICRICGDDPALDHQQMSAELQQIRGPYTLSDGIAAFARHNESHNGTGEMQR